MGEDLRCQIRKEITIREKERLRNFATEEEKMKEDIKQIIITSFEKELRELLKERKEFEKFRIPDQYSERRRICEVSKELGFAKKMVYDYKEKNHFFVFSVPEFHTGKPTFVQERLEKFREHLQWEKQFREKQIKKQCNCILHEIKRGQYGYSYLEDIIYVEAKEEQLNIEDINVISEFFMVYNLHFKNFEDGNLYFAL